MESAPPTFLPILEPASAKHSTDHTMSIRVAALGDGLVDLSPYGFRILPVSPFNSKIWPPSPRISLIPKDRRGEGGGGHISSGPSSLGRCRSSEDRGDKFADFSHRLVQLEGKPHQVHAFEFTMLLQENLPCRIVG